MRDTTPLGNPPNIQQFPYCPSNSTEKCVSFCSLALIMMFGILALNPQLRRTWSCSFAGGGETYFDDVGQSCFSQSCEIVVYQVFVEPSFWGFTFNTVSGGGLHLNV
ncbi:hypothetical protein BU26DRAFT_222838 [Trematosphaeria pertusa]|uniref:Uncharacterized protein n=1 Tax=Trematosphaeria pertusa TaxID=390896 RepID=A0A6A6IV06_9PLEO|nr:uncharacterized protein BU26DRAFT_222838 [Trematosphaeria pertusa]KAF2253440.1 hypothetical protein BU26DRAFT_222838 [Trematosphaeria pertusa]